MRFSTLLLTIAMLAGPASAVAQGSWIETRMEPWRGSSYNYRICSELQTPNSTSIWASTINNIGLGITNYEAYRSLDNGLTWESSTVASSLILPTRGTSVLDLWAANGQTAWLTLRDLSSGQYTVHRTSTGPSGFAPVAALTMATELRGVRFFDANVGVLLGQPAGSTPAWLVQRTTDGGQSWQPVAAVPPAGATDKLTDIELLGDKLWACTTLGNVLYSSTQGQSWALAATGLGADLLGVSFRDGNNGLAYGKGGLLRRTTDGGQSWSPVSVTGPMRLQQIAAIPGSTGSYISVGSDPINTSTPGDSFGSAITTNDGATWQNVENAIPFERVAVIDAGRILAVSGLGTSAKLYRYTGQALATKASTLTRAGLYPNPSTGIVQLEAGSTERQVALFDPAGRLLQTVQVPAQVSQVDISSLPAGVYHVRITDQKREQVQSGKVVLVH